MKKHQEKQIFGLVSLADPYGVIAEIGSVEEQLGSSVPWVNRYMEIDSPFPMEVAQSLDGAGKKLVISWMPHRTEEMGHNRGEPLGNSGLHRILKGEWDGYLEDFARKAAAFGKPVYLKFMHEFNAGWYVWGGPKNGGARGASLVKEAWIYTVERFRSLGAHNVQWIWCVHEDSFHVPTEQWNRLKNYWPGEEYVDLLAIDGFNFYPDNPERHNARFLTFPQAMETMYRELRELAPLPVMVMTGSAEFRGEGEISTKALWVEQMFRSIQGDFSAVEALFWFNHKYSDEVDWRVNSSPEVLQAFKKGMNHYEA